MNVVNTDPYFIKASNSIFEFSKLLLQDCNVRRFECELNTINKTKKQIKYVFIGR